MEPFISFGSMPIANGFLTPDLFGAEYFYDLSVCFCENCGMVQLKDQPELAQMFHASYPFLTGTSNAMQQHFTQWGKSLQDRIAENAFVVEIGSNDGTLLRSFAGQGIKHLGVDPSQNVNQYAQEQGIQTLCAFFDAEAASLIKGEHGQADLVLAANVMCHIPNLHSALEGIQTLLKPSGWFVFEEPYLGDVLEKTAFDQFYDEHVFMFSLKSLKRALEAHGLEIFHVEHQWTHGGSLRYFVGHKGKGTLSSVSRFEQNEIEAGLHEPETYRAFADRCPQTRDQLRELLLSFKQEGRQTAGYAATSKSTTVLNFCDITPDLLPRIYDTTPMKHEKFTPGTHIPVINYEEFKNHYPDYAVLLAWNHEDEIFRKEQTYRKQGGQWVRFVPKVEIL